MILTDQQIDLINKYSTSMWAASCSLDLKTEVIRLSGAQVAEDKAHINLFVPQPYAQTFLINLEQNLKISMMIASTSTFEAYQMKGLFLGYRACTNEEMKLQKKYMEGFAQCMINLGIKIAAKFATYYREPSLAIQMVAQEIYEQTPKTGTGRKIS